LGLLFVDNLNDSKKADLSGAREWPGVRGAPLGSGGFWLWPFTSIRKTTFEQKAAKITKKKWGKREECAPTG
jgi:hypothetical protein